MSKVKHVYEVGQNVRFERANGYVYAVITRIKSKSNGLHIYATQKDGTRCKFFIPTDKSVLENLCETCGGEGVIEYDDDYNGSGGLVAEGRAVKCHCQLEDGENEE